MNAHWLFGIIAVPMLFAAPAVAATPVQAPPGGLDVHVVNPSDDPVPVTIEGQMRPSRIRSTQAVSLTPTASAPCSSRSPTATVS